MTETKYGKYIIDRPKDGLRPPGLTDEELKETGDTRMYKKEISKDDKQKRLADQPERSSK